MWILKLESHRKWHWLAVIIGTSLLLLQVRPVLARTLPHTSARSRSPAVEDDRPSSKYLRQLDELSALWSHYRYEHIRSGRVVSWDEGGITTSEGQGYAMLRAVWSNDRKTFAAVWSWTQQHLQTRDDKLFAWKWNGRQVDANSATDADTDIALSLVLAYRRFGNEKYLSEARAILKDIWEQEVVQAGERYYLTAGNWASHEQYPTVHVAYFAPYAYEVFTHVDSRHPWGQLVKSSYHVLHRIYDEWGLKLPPEIVYLDRQKGEVQLQRPGYGKTAAFGYDAVPIFWRLALDQRWFGRHERGLRKNMLRFFKDEWAARGAILDRYTLEGRAASSYEGLPLYASVHSLAEVEEPELAREIRIRKLDSLWAGARVGHQLPYYLQNWLWFDRALELKVTVHYDEFLGFLRPFDFVSFSACFPWALFLVTLGLYPLTSRHSLFKFAFLACGLILCGRYLHWRLFNSLNFLEESGPVISIMLWLAELYCFSTVLLLVLQVGIRVVPRRTSVSLPGGLTEFAPSVDVFIPIYSESLEILEKTLIAATGMDYVNKMIHVLDDSHRDDVRELAERLGANYIRGPRQHAKAGNINHALTKTDGELVLIFDTDHIPVRSFLSETVPNFADPKMGFVQTPHHFYNEDIFQHAFRTDGLMPNEQDMFNHAIQGGRNSWGGAFFVGSGAIFRRRAIEELGGFKLMSITEDIHTSQHLHAKGWKSAFVDKDLAVGLSAENFAGYIVQRRRWMLGCLQIFFKDNPLFCKGLGLRHRLGYFSSLYYFLFPIPRLIFWVTPLYFLLFHWHPIFSEVSILVAYLVPYMVMLPLLSSALLPGWPRVLWGSMYESTVAFPLFRSMFDLFLPKSLGFKVTPKGIVSRKRRFDVASSMATLVAVGITIVAISKGVIEFYCFGIEKDAYFFNLAWAFVNLLFLLMGLLVAWERPQRRVEERVKAEVPYRIEAGAFRFEGVTSDISLSGVSFFVYKPLEIPLDLALTLKLDGKEISVVAKRVYFDRVGREKYKCALQYAEASESLKTGVIRGVFGSAEYWSKSHLRKPRSNFSVAALFLLGLVRGLLPKRSNTRRDEPRRKTWRWLRLPKTGPAALAWVRDASSRGLGVLYIGLTAPEKTDLWVDVGREVYAKRILPGIWRVGFELSAGMRSQRIESIRMESTQRGGQSIA